MSRDEAQRVAWRAEEDEALPITEAEFTAQERTADLNAAEPSSIDSYDEPWERHHAEVMMATAEWKYR